MLNGLGVDFDFFDAVDGSALSPTDIARYDPKGTRHIHGRELTPGEIGCALSHVYVWKALLTSEESELLVLEDDAEVGIALLEILKTRARFPAGWELINFVSDTRCDPFGDKLWDIYRIAAFRWASNRTACYLINRKGAKRLLDHAYPIRWTADGLTGRATETGLAIYGVWPPIAAVSGEPSTIEERGISSTRRPDVPTVVKRLFRRTLWLES